LQRLGASDSSGISGQTDQDKRRLLPPASEADADDPAAFAQSKYTKKEERLPDVFCYAHETQTGTAALERKGQQRLWGKDNSLQASCLLPSLPSMSPTFINMSGRNCLPAGNFDVDS
jgi:hypothetical protein